METSKREPRGASDGPLNLNGGNMSDGNRYRKWAAQVARQAGEEADAADAQRLLSIAEYWVRLADSEEFNQPVDGPGMTDAPPSSRHRGLIGG